MTPTLRSTRPWLHALFTSKARGILALVVVATILFLLLASRNLSANSTLPTHEAQKPPLQLPNILIGILTIASKIDRRDLIRSTYLRATPSGIDVKFVLGRIHNSTLARTVAGEQEQYGDIMILDCEENMDEGKTFEFFHTVAHKYHNSNPPPSAATSHYTYVMKADDDTYINLPSLQSRFSTLPKHHLYYGNDYYNLGHTRGPLSVIMFGYLYAVSWDIVQWIGSDPPQTKARSGPEDIVFARWLREGDVVENWVSDGGAIYGGQTDADVEAGMYGPETIAVHPLKDDRKFLKVAHQLMESGGRAESGTGEHDRIGKKCVMRVKGDGTLRSCPPLPES
ncbi:hypothetical protein HDV00_001324 [Rhizophlyctis rosea]|nr:hypothetical protein HDV00_001324 [Rhizophlyctis rosea]